MVARKWETINWLNENLCYHVIDFWEHLTDKESILDRLKSILKDGLLTAHEQWRKKNLKGVTHPNSIDVFAGKEMCKETWIRQAVSEYWTSVGLLLEWKNEELPYKMQFRSPFYSFRNATIEIGETPKIVGLIIKDDYLYMDIDSEFQQKVSQIAKNHGIILLDKKLNPISL